MEHVKIKVIGTDGFLRDTTIGKVYNARRYDVEDITEHGDVVFKHEAPSYFFEDDVGDTVDTLPDMSGVYIQEVTND